MLVLVSTAGPYLVLEGSFTLALLKRFQYSCSLQSGTQLADEEVVGPFVSRFDDFPGIMVHEALQRTAVDRQDLIANFNNPRQLCSTSCCREVQQFSLLKDTLHDFVFQKCPFNLLLIFWIHTLLWWQASEECKPESAFRWREFTYYFIKPSYKSSGYNLIISNCSLHSSQPRQHKNQRIVTIFF